MSLQHIKSRFLERFRISRWLCLWLCICQCLLQLSKMELCTYLENSLLCLTFRVYFIQVAEGTGYFFYLGWVRRVDRDEVIELSLDFGRSSGCWTDRIIWTALENSPESEKTGIKNLKLNGKSKCRAGFWLLNFLYQLLKTSLAPENFTSRTV